MSLKKRMKKFFRETTPEQIIAEFEKLGYEFIDIDSKENVKIKTKMKNKLIELIDELREELKPNAYIKITNAIQSLPDDESDMLPFEYPVKEGYEVVTGDGRKVEQLRFDAQDEAYPILGVLNGLVESWTPDGLYCIDASNYNGGNDLFLRRVEKKVWVVEWQNGVRSIYNEFPTPITDPDAIIYEATLKELK